MERIVSDVVANLRDGELVPETSSKWLSKRQVSEYLQVSLITIRQYEKEGKLAGHRSEGSSRVYFERAEIDGMLKIGQIAQRKKRQTRTVSHK